MDLGMPLSTGGNITVTHQFGLRVIVKEEDIKEEEYGQMIGCPDEEGKPFAELHCETETDITESNVTCNETLHETVEIEVKKEDEQEHDLLENRQPTALILGCNYIRNGEERARRSLGRNLGANAQVEWLGLDGMRWHSVVPCFYDWLRGKFAPDVLLIHCGGNDLGKLTSLRLVAAMKRDLQDLHQRFPNMLIVYSAITQRRCWGSVRPKRIERSRKWVNSEMATFVMGMNGGIVHHRYIRFYKPELFLRDTFHLSTLGNDIFLNAFSECLRTIFP
ncbi:uncharacterized protein LOC121718961 isoform X3 [Alosa sapidissima]|uniref:uncharacterized protein LOC121718961 isoform X3 n=1 Tax=Alosa sapidissima TaxID=34773 RepID=UPI001C0A478A|nr:uncharacterized protein LOC121718961 isoform X3 [Alosa sapidissima]